MIWLILGLLLWCAGHFFKRAMPDVRAGLGDAGRGVSAGIILAGVVLMVIGYRAADPAYLWALPDWSRHLNNLLMLIAVYLYAVSGMKTRVAQHIRHPMLWGTVVWAVAHLLVNGDVPSLILFGGLTVWALAEMAVINRAEAPWHKPPIKPAKSEAMALVGTVIVYAVLVGLHGLLGPWPVG